MAKQIDRRSLLKTSRALPGRLRLWPYLLGRVFTFRKSDRQHHLSRAKYSPSHLAVGQVLR